MMHFRDSLSRKLTVMNMLVSGGALLLASMAFFAYDMITFRNNLANNTAIEAQIIGSNAVSPLIFNDQQSAENTLAAFKASRNIVYAGIYTEKGDFFAGYWRDAVHQPLSLPAAASDRVEFSQFQSDRFRLVQTIIFQGKPAGIVYLVSDLSAINQRLRNYAIILLAILGASLVAALVLSRISQRVISQPILLLADKARLISREKDYSVRAPTSGDHDEVASLVAAFNEMLFEIQKRDSALQESERQFRTLSDSIPQLAWMAEPDGRLFWYNRRWYEYTGKTAEEMVGWGWELVNDPDILPLVRQKWRESLRSGEPFEMNIPLRGADGTFRHFLTRALPVRDIRGKIVRWFGTNTDVTEQRRSEEALRQTEKLAATGRLAASIAHEINNPLEAVTNLVYLARTQPLNVQKYLKLADQELDRIAQITKNTLGFYRDSAAPSVVDIAQVLREVMVLYSRKIQFKKIALETDYRSEVEVSVYPGEVRQIFANLAANAIEAMSDAGRLRIRARKSHSWNGVQQQGVRVTFLDNGTGISPDQIKRIFEPFYTTKKDVGTGLGLWLTLGLVEKHQGSLRVRSSVRPGNTWTAFSIFLPDLRQPAAASAATYSVQETERPS